jgi:hypothetical protein
MSEDDIKAMAVKLAMLVDSFETRGDKVVQQNVQAAETIRMAAQSVSQVAHEVSASAVEEFRHAAGATLSHGLREPLAQAEKHLESAMLDVRNAAADLQQRVSQAGRVHTATAWKAFIACAVGGLLVIGAAAYTVMRAHTEVANAAWTARINAAIAAGNLAPCADGGICARVDGKRWVRLDQVQEAHR